MRRISTHQYKSVTIYTRGFHEPEGEQSYKDPLFITSKIITALADTNLAQMDITQLPFKDGYKDLWSPTRNSTVCLAKLHQCPKTHYWEHLDLGPESTGGLRSCGHPNLANLESKHGTVPTLLILRKNKPSAKFSISDMSSIQYDFRILRSLARTVIYAL